MFTCFFVSFFSAIYEAHYAGRWKDSQEKADVVAHIGEREAKKRRYI